MVPRSGLPRRLERLYDFLDDFSRTGVLFILRNANMAVTTDQRFVTVAALKFGLARITDIICVAKSGAYATACVGGIYSAASKGGSAWVANSQSYSGLTAANKLQTLTLAAVAGTDVISSAPYLSLTTANGGALTADLFVRGVILD